jgi:aspartyl/asparaginyl beta-hydroxylase (cupin superfamily)
MGKGTLKYILTSFVDIWSIPSLSWKKIYFPENIQKKKEILWQNRKIDDLWWKYRKKSKHHSFYHDPMK